MKRIAFGLLMMLVLLASCSTPTPAVDYPATLAAVSVQQTVSVVEKATLVAQATAMAQQLTAIAMQPTPTCPVCELPTPTPPPPPTATPTTGPTPTATTGPTGSISGRLAYPSEFLPAQRVIAFNTVTGYYYWLNTPDGQGYYKLDNLPVGTYHVLAYLVNKPSDDLRAAYTPAAACTFNQGTNCDDHSLIVVEVKAGEESKEINPVDWYAPDPTAAGWPVDPTIKR